jgi:hypothetical protein
MAKWQPLGSKYTATTSSSGCRLGNIQYVLIGIIFINENIFGIRNEERA